MKKTTRQIAMCGVVAALYAAVTILTASFAFGPVQFRIADALTVLCCFEPTAALGVFLGCVIANLFSTVSALDIVVGSAATLLACLLTVKIRKPWLVPVPSILLNAVFVGAELAFVMTPDALIHGFFLMGAQVAIGEIAVGYVLGVPLFLYLRKSGLVARIMGR